MNRDLNLVAISFSSGWTRWLCLLRPKSQSVTFYRCHLLLLLAHVIQPPTPAAKAAIEADKKAAAERIEAMTHSSKASIKEGAESAKTAANELIGRAADKVEEKKDDLKSLGKEKEASGEAGLSVIGALIKDSWTDFKLEKVEPYNHNTAM